MFSNHYKVSGQLHSQLNQPDLTVQQLFAIPNIVGDIKQNIQFFLTFCKKRKQFTTSMLQLCFDSSYSTLQVEQNKTVVHNAIDILSSDEDALAAFLFSHPDHKPSKNNSQISQKIEDGTDNIVTDAQRLFGDENDAEEALWKKDSDAFEKYELVSLSLNILSNPSKNQTCLGFLNKIYSTLIRREASQFLQFLELHQHYVELMMQGISHYAIGNLVVLILSCEDRSGQYKFENLKMEIFERLLAKTFQVIEDRQKFEGVLITIEEILNTTKQSYYEYFDDFKRCANVLVSQQALSKFIAYVKSQNGNSFINALGYLELILKRINTENDDHENDYYRQNQTDSTMKFEHQFMFQQFSDFVSIAESLVKSEETSVKKMIFFSFIVQLLKNNEYKENSENSLKHFQTFLELMIQEKTHGMVKNYLYQIVHLKLTKMSEETIVQVLEWIFKEANKSVQGQIEKINPEESLRRINSNQVGCFMSKILYTLKGKNPSFFEEVEESQRKKVKKLSEKYEVKLAKEEEKVEKNILNHDFKLELPLNYIKKRKQPEEEDKNGIIIPTLNLPNSESVEVVEQEEVKEEEFDEQNREQQPRCNGEPSRESVIEDLKNTKIELPEKFRKKVKEPEVNREKVLEEIKFFIKHLILF